MARRSNPPAPAIALSLALGAGGCYHYEAMRVEVAAALTGEPVPGALVEASPINADGPVSARSLIGLPPMPGSAGGRTGPQGWIDLSLAIEDPIHIRVLAPGLAPFEFILDRHPAIAGAGAWVSLDTDLNAPVALHAMRVRFSVPPTAP